MKYKIRTAVPTDEGKIRELFLEMLRTAERFAVCENALEPVLLHL